MPGRIYYIAVCVYGGGMAVFTGIFSYPVLTGQSVMTIGTHSESISELSPVARIAGQWPCLAPGHGLVLIVLMPDRVGVWCRVCITVAVKISAGPVSISRGVAGGLTIDARGVD